MSTKHWIELIVILLLVSNFATFVWRDWLKKKAIQKLNDIPQEEKKI